MRATVLWLVVMLAGCAGPVRTTLDESPTASVPANTSVGDMSDCRSQAARQAEMRYPRQPLDAPGSRRTIVVPDDPAKSEAAQRFFRMCMEQKARVSAAAGAARSPS